MYRLFAFCKRCEKNAGADTLGPSVSAPRAADTLGQMGSLLFSAFLAQINIRFFMVTGLVRFGRPEVELAKSAGAQETQPNSPLVSAQMNKCVLALFGIFCRRFWHLLFVFPPGFVEQI